MRSKESIKYIIITVLIIIVLFSCYKFVNYYRYTFDEPDGVEDVIKGFKNKKEVIISRKQLSLDESIVIDCLKIKNIFDGYMKEESNSDTTIIYKKEIDGRNYYFHFIRDDQVPIVDGFVNDQIVIFDQNIVGSTFKLIGAILGLIYITNFTSAMSDSLWHINNALADNWMTFKKVFFGLLIASLACVVLAFIPIINILAAIALVIIAIGLIGVGIWQLVLLFMSAGAVRNYLK